MSIRESILPTAYLRPLRSLASYKPVPFSLNPSSSHTTVLFTPPYHQLTHIRFRIHERPRVELHHKASLHATAHPFNPRPCRPRPYYVQPSTFSGNYFSVVLMVSLDSSYENCVQFYLVIVGPLFLCLFHVALDSFPVSSRITSRPL